MSKKFRPFLTSRPALQLIYRIIRLYSATFRLTIENEQAWMDYVKGGGKVLLCTWHQQFFAAIRHFKSYSVFKPSLMISKSFDGEIIAGVAVPKGARYFFINALTTISAVVFLYAPETKVAAIAILNLDEAGEIGAAAAMAVLIAAANTVATLGFMALGAWVGKRTQAWKKP